MPLYYFRFEDGEPVGHEDGEGFSSDDIAHAVAEQTALELTKNRSQHGLRQIIVRTASGKVICEVPVVPN